MWCAFHSSANCLSVPYLPGSHTKRKRSSSNHPFSALPYYMYLTFKEGFNSVQPLLHPPNPSPLPKIKNHKHITNTSGRSWCSPTSPPPTTHRSRARFESANRWVRRSKGHGTDNEDFPSEVLTFPPKRELQSKKKSQIGPMMRSRL